MRTFAIIVSSLSVLTASQAFAWGAAGHETVAKIAENILIARDAGRPAGQRTMDQIQAILLAGDCAKENSAKEARFADVQYGGPNESAFVQGAVWLDDARAWIAEQGNTTTLAPEDQVFAASAGWHFVNLPLTAKRGEFDGQSVCKGGACAAEQIQNFVLKLMSMRSVDTSAPGTTRTDALNKCRALKTIVHLVGDLHQPMHAVDFNDDKGGNLRQVNFYFVNSNGPTVGRSTRANLHSIWDGNLLKDMMFRTNLKTVGTFGDMLTKEIAQDVSTTNVSDRMPFLVFAPFAMLRNSPWDWAWESHDAAVHAYQNEEGDLQADALPPLPPAQAGQRAPQAAPFDIGSAYGTAADAVIRDQLKKGGLRLADLLDKALNQGY